MPPDYQWILDGGLTAALMWALWWVVRKWERSEEKYEAERTARSSEATTAATALTAEKLLNVDAKAALAFRDYRIADLTRDLERCERRREQRGAAGAPEGRSDRTQEAL